MDILDTITSQKQAENFSQHRMEQSRLLPHKFYTRYFKDETETLKQGRPIFISKDYIVIYTDEINKLDMVATDEYKARYSESWDYYVKNIKQNPQVNGTLITEANFISQSEALSLKELGVFTVEQLATLQGHPQVDSKLVELADMYIQQSSIEGGFNQLLSIIKDLKSQVDRQLKIIEGLRNDS